MFKTNKKTLKIKELVRLQHWHAHAPVTSALPAIANGSSGLMAFCGPSTGAAKGHRGASNSPINHVTGGWCGTTFGSRDYSGLSYCSASQRPTLQAWVHWCVRARTCVCVCVFKGASSARFPPPLVRELIGRFGPALCSLPTIWSWSSGWPLLLARSRAPTASHPPSSLVVVDSSNHPGQSRRSALRIREGRTRRIELAVQLRPGAERPRCGGARAACWGDREAAAD